jgi:hypothetical protein
LGWLSISGRRPISAFVGILDSGKGDIIFVGPLGSKQAEFLEYTGIAVLVAERTRCG